MKGIRLLIAAAATAALAALPRPVWASPSQCDAIAGNLVANCGFETGDFTDWTLRGNTGFLSVESNFSGYLPHSGNYFASLGAVGSLGYLSQTVSDTAGQQYTFSLYYASNGTFPNELDVEFNSTTLFDQTRVC